MRGGVGRWIVVLVTVLGMLWGSVPLVRAQAPAPAPPQPLRAPNDERLGVNESFYASNLAKKLGARWTRWTIEWEHLQRSGPRDFNDFYIDQRILDREISNGFRVAGLIKNTPAWAARNPEFGPKSPPRNLDQPVFLPSGAINVENYFGNVMYELARRYAGKIDVWMIWNEVDIPPVGPNAMYNTWMGSLQDYYQLLKVGYQAVKRANPNATVVLAPYSFMRNKRWWQEFLNVASADPEGPANGYFFDVLALNLYRNPHDAWDLMKGTADVRGQADDCETVRRDGDVAVRMPDEQFEALPYAEQIRGIELLRQCYGIPDKPVWLTEVNSMPYDDPYVDGWDPAHRNDYFRITQDDQASYVIQLYALALAAGYQKVFWQAMQDDRPPVPDELWGLVRYHPDMLNADPARVRPVYRAYQVMAEALGGAQRIELATLNRPDSAGYSRYAPRYQWLVHLVAAQRGDRRASILWNGDGVPITVSIPRWGAIAEVVDKYGNRRPLEPSPDGTRWVVTLDAAVRHFEHPVFGSDPPGYYYVGGSPLIIFEYGVPSDAPVEAPSLG